MIWSDDQVKSQLLAEVAVQNYYPTLIIGFKCVKCDLVHWMCI